MSATGESSGTLGWARVFPALHRSTSKTLRRGAWYPVVDNSQPDRVSIRMGERTVVVPRRILEMRRTRPAHFSVIGRVGYQSGRPSLHNLGPQYAVCPRCGGRQALWGRPERKTCPECGHEAEVAWWEV